MTKCDVKMVGCWQSSVVCIFKGQDEVEDQRNAKKKKKKTENKAYIQQSWLNKPVN